MGREGQIWEELGEKINVVKIHKIPEELIRIFKKRKAWEKNLLD